LSAVDDRAARGCACVTPYIHGLSPTLQRGTWMPPVTPCNTRALCLSRWCSLINSYWARYSAWAVLCRSSGKVMSLDHEDAPGAPPFRVKRTPLPHQTDAPSHLAGGRLKRGSSGVGSRPVG
jgi:hypothetical protein